MHNIDLLGTYIQSQKLQLYVVVVSVLLACFPKEWRPLVDGHDVKIVVYIHTTIALRVQAPLKPGVRSINPELLL